MNANAREENDQHIDSQQIAENNARLREYIVLQKSLLDKVFNETKWYVGVELGRDPMADEQGRQILNIRYANVLVSGTGRWVSEQVTGANNS